MLALLLSGAEMAGQGDINDPLAFAGGTPTLTTGGTSAPPAQGGLEVDSGGYQHDPDFFLGSLTLASVAPSLSVGTVVHAGGNGDVGDVYGSPDLSSSDPHVSALSSWQSATSALALGTVTHPGGQGDLGDVGGPTVLNGADNDSNAGVGTLTSWSFGVGTIALGSLPPATAHGDIGEMYGMGEGPIGQLVWQVAAPSLVTGALTTPTGQGDIPDPFAWMDVITYLTSNLYPLEQLDHIMMAGFAKNSPQPETIEHVTNAGFFTGGTLTGALFVYSNWPAEHVSCAASFASGTLTLALITYTNWPAEHITCAGSFTGGTLATGLISYTNWPTEHITSIGFFSGGTLT